MSRCGGPSLTESRRPVALGTSAGLPEARGQDTTLPTLDTRPPAKAILPRGGEVAKICSYRISHH
jgi:hypothetical protein